MGTAGDHEPIFKRKMKYSPKNYQLEATRFILDNPCCGIFADPGLGKTALTLSAIAELMRAGRVRKVVVIAPIQICYDVWPQEIAKWDEFRHLRTSILHGSKKTHASKTPADIYLVNPEGLQWFFERFKTFGPDVMLVIDESSKFKSPQTVRFKTLKKKLLNFPRRVILTGTPAPNSLADLWSQIFLLDEGKALGKTVSMFRHTYCYIENPKYFTWGIRPDSQEAIQRAVAPYVVRIDAATHLDLPPLMSNHIRVSLPEKALKAYKEMEKTLFAHLETGDTVLAPSAGAAYNLCHQASQGFFYADTDVDGVRHVHELHDAKVEALENLVGELQGKPILIGYHYRHDAKLVNKALGGKGNFLGDDRVHNSRLLDAWNAGRLTNLCGQIASMSHGLNLQAGGNDLCFFSLTDNPEDYTQMIRRLYRQGVVGQVRVHHLVARNTVDEAILRRQEKKDKTQRALLEALKEYRNEEKNIDC